MLPTISLTPETKVIRADKTALVVCAVKVVDKNGVTVPAANNQITFKVSGAGALAGVDNGQNTSTESYRAAFITAWSGLALAIVQADGSGGPITVTASSPGLLPASTTVYSTHVWER